MTVEATDENPWDRVKFRAVYEAHYDDIWRYCYRRAGDRAQAEDLLAETFATAWQKVNQIPQENEALPWLYAVAYNHMRNGWRQSKQRQNLAEKLRNEASTDADPLDPADYAAGGIGLVREAIFSLSDTDREVLMLTSWERLSHRQIAEVLNITENAVSIRAHRAKQKLQKKLAKEMKGSAVERHKDSNRHPLSGGIL